VKHQVTQPCIIVGEPAGAAAFCQELQAQGVKFVAPMQTVAQLRRHLVLGEDASLSLCVLMDVPHASAVERDRIARLLEDRKNFPTRVFALGVLSQDQPLGSAASIGCDAYVRTSGEAVSVLLAVAKASSSGMETISVQRFLRSITVAPVAEPLVHRAAAVQRAGTVPSVRQRQPRIARSAIEPGGGRMPPA